MRTDKAKTMYCPYVAMKCQGEKCMAWEIKPDSDEGRCMRVRVDALHGEYLAIMTSLDPNDLRGKIGRV